MPQPRCRRRSLSLGRRIVCDTIMASGVSWVAAAERRMCLPEVVAARQAARPRPSWGAIMTKAFALVATEHPAMRQFYCGFPFGHIGEFEYSIGCVMVDRRINGEDTIFRCRLVRPEEQSLAQLDSQLCRYRDEPPHTIRSLKETMRFVRVPWPLRRWLFWLALHVIPSRRARHFGTFGVTTMSPYGAKTLQVPTPWGALLHYGPISETGEVEVGISFDHRVMDGRVVGFTLLEMEQALRHNITAELQSMSAPAARAA